jgi:copper chaperone CopZ
MAVKKDAVKEDDEVKVEEVEAPKSVQVDPDLVVAAVKKRYSITDIDGVLKTFQPGHITMSRADAEHWYSVANGTAIIGKPDNGDLNGVGAKARLKEIVSNLDSLAANITSFEVQHAGMTKEQSDSFIKASKFVEGAFKILGAI